MVSGSPADSFWKPPTLGGFATCLPATVPVNLTSPGTSYKWNHEVFALLWVVYFTQHVLSLCTMPSSFVHVEFPSFSRHCCFLIYLLPLTSLLPGLLQSHLFPCPFLKCDSCPIFCLWLSSPFTWCWAAWFILLASITNVGGWLPVLDLLPRLFILGLVLYIQLFTRNHSQTIPPQ